MRWLRAHLTYANVMSTLAVFLVIGGGAAYAANTIFSSDIVDGEVKSSDLANGAVANAKLAGGAVTSDKLADESLKGRDVLDNTLRGADIDESTLSNVGGGGGAGGDLTGTYPNPEIAANAINGANVANNSLKGADVDESTLGQVPSALSATLGGRGGPIQDTCDPEDTTFVTCASVALTVPPGPEVGALVFGHARAFAEPGLSEGIGICRLATSTAGPIAGSTVGFAVSAGSPEVINLVGVVPLLGPGPHSFGIECNQNDTDSEIDYDEASVQVVALAPG